MRKLRFRLLSLVAVAVLVGTAAQAGSTSTGQSLTKITYATSFGTFGRDAYVYAAIERGFFREAGFDVTVIPGNGSVDNMRLVAAGRLDFAPVDITALVITRANEGIPVKALSLVHQKTLSAIFTLEESGIAVPRDLEGKTIADVPGSAIRALFPLYARRSGFNPSTVTFVPASPPALPGLLASKQVPAVGQFTVGKPLFSRAAGGKPIRAFRYDKVFPGLMGIAVVASDDRIRTKAAETRRFIAALNRGLKWSIDNPGQAGRILHEAVPLADFAIAARELRIMKPFVQTPVTRTRGIGYIDQQRVNSTISIVRSGFQLNNSITAGNVYAPGFVTVPKKR